LKTQPPGHIKAPFWTPTGRNTPWEPGGHQAKTNAPPQQRIKTGRQGDPPLFSEIQFQITSPSYRLRLFRGRALQCFTSRPARWGVQRLLLVVSCIWPPKGQSRSFVSINPEGPARSIGRGTGGTPAQRPAWCGFVFPNLLALPRKSLRAIGSFISASFKSGNRGGGTGKVRAVPLRGADHIPEAARVVRSQQVIDQLPASGRLAMTAQALGQLSSTWIAEKPTCPLLD